MVEGNIWDDSLNDLSISDLAKVSSYTEISQKLRTYADNTLKGVYHCARCGSSLYSSEDKFTPLESGADEWPTFRAAISPKSIQFQHTFSFGINSTQIHCAICGLFLGSFYEDGKECGDSHENAKERHSLNSFTLHFVKDQSEVGEEKIQQTPRELTPLLQKEKILVPVEAEPEPKPVVKQSAPINDIKVDDKINNNNNNNDEDKNKKKSTTTATTTTNKDEQVRKLLGDLNDDKKPTKKTTKGEKKSEGGSNTVLTVVIGGVVIAAAAGAIYYFTSKNNNNK